jgi:hypothetical protein
VRVSRSRVRAKPRLPSRPPASPADDHSVAEDLCDLPRRHRQRAAVCNAGRRRSDARSYAGHRSVADTLEASASVSTTIPSHHRGTGRPCCDDARRVVGVRAAVGLAGLLSNALKAELGTVARARAHGRPAHRRLSRQPVSRQYRITQQATLGAQSRSHGHDRTGGNRARRTRPLGRTSDSEIRPGASPQ